jgi:hypothetical protein
VITFRSALALSPGPRRTGALAAWFQSLYRGERETPILVGGAVVELLTGGAYTTGDLDFVGGVPAGVAEKLRAASFRKEGRHWIHEKGHVFIELPGGRLEPEEQVVRIRSGASTVLAISPEDILIDRLASWQFWASSVDGINAYLIWRKQNRRLNQRRLTRLAKKREVGPALKSLRSLISRSKGRAVRPKELELWAGKRF